MNINKFKRVIFSLVGKNYMKEKSSLLVAVENEDVEQIKALLETMSKKEINAIYNYELTDHHSKDSPLKTAFFQACMSNNKEIIEAFLDCHKVNLNWQNDNKDIAFFKIAKNAPLETVKKMVDCPNINIHLRNAYDENILHIIAQRTFHQKDIQDSTELFQYVMNKGVDYHKRTKITYSNVFDLAIESRQEKLVKFLLTTNIEKEHPHKANIEQMYSAIWSDITIKSNLAKLLIDNGYNFHNFLEYFEENNDELDKLRMMQNQDFIDKKEEILAYIKTHEEKAYLSSIIKDVPSLDSKIKAIRSEKDEATIKLPQSKRKDKI